MKRQGDGVSLKEQWIREGFSNYYVVEKKEKITYEKDILLHHPMECLLPCELRMEDETQYYYFETGIYTAWSEKRNEIDPEEFFYNFFIALEEIEGYLLDLDHLKIDETLLFVNSEGKPVFCYLPDYEKNIFEQIRELLEESMEHMSYENRKKVRFYYEFHSYLVKEKPNISQIKEYLKPVPNVILKEEIEDLPEEDTLLFEDKKEPDQKIFVVTILLSILSVLLIGTAAFFVVKVFMYGFYYQFVLGFLVCVGGFLTDMWQLWKLRKKETIDIPKEIGEMKTEYLFSDEQKTVCLTEQPLGRLSSKKNAQEIVIEHDGFVIGSSMEGTDYQLSTVGVSRRHVRFILENEEIVAEDLDSTNGTRINGRRITRKKLETGDILKIGLEEFEFLLDIGYTI